MYPGQITSKTQKPRQQFAEARPGMQSLEALDYLPARPASVQQHAQHIRQARQITI
jgi:hypothetical protein